jgi:hypothetical protein
MSGGKELSKSSTRYCRDINTKMFLAHLDNEWNPKQLFIPIGNMKPPQFQPNSVPDFLFSSKHSHPPSNDERSPLI